MNALVDVKLVVDLLAILLSNELSLLTLVVGDLYLELLTDLTGDWVIKTVKKVTDDTEGLGDDTADLSRVIASFATFDSQIDDADTSKRRCEPKLFVVESTRVHAEHGIRDTDERLCLREESEETGGA